MASRPLRIFLLLGLFVPAFSGLLFNRDVSAVSNSKALPVPVISRFFSQPIHDLRKPTEMFWSLRPQRQQRHVEDQPVEVVANNKVNKQLADLAALNMLRQMLRWKSDSVSRAMKRDIPMQVTKLMLEGGVY